MFKGDACHGGLEAMGAGEEDTSSAFSAECMSRNQNQTVMSRLKTAIKYCSFLLTVMALWCLLPTCATCF